MKYPENNLEACFYNQLPTYTPVFNLSTIEHFMWVHLPSICIERCGTLFEISEIVDGKSVEVNIYSTITREGNKPWLRLLSSSLNLSTGQHIYKLSFIDKHTDDVFSLYISYIIQNDNPDKPYIYMNRDDNTISDGTQYNRYETQV